MTLFLPPLSEFPFFFYARDNKPPTIVAAIVLVRGNIRGGGAKFPSPVGSRVSSLNGGGEGAKHRRIKSRYASAVNRDMPDAAGYRSFLVHACKGETFGFVGEPRNFWLAYFLSLRREFLSPVFAVVAVCCLLSTIESGADN